MKSVVHIGDCRMILHNLAASSLDACVTDPPYHLTQASRNGSPRNNDPETPFGRTRLGERGFMGKTWDGGDIAFQVDLWREILRVLKPGAHLLAFGGTRTYHRMAVAIEDAGFEIRDSIHWLYGSGFPKNAQTALKPAHEPIVVGRKPLVGPVAKNARLFGTGALNIDACRIPNEGGRHREGESSQESRYSNSGGTNFAMLPGPRGGDPAGRWPANIILSHSPDCGDNCTDDCPARVLDEQSGTLTSGAWDGKRSTPKTSGIFGAFAHGTTEAPRYGDSGGASRFFYVAKAPRSERDAGLDGRNPHPTVKPIGIMRHLVRLVTPPGGTVLDPFTGSGTTGCASALEGFAFVGCELSPEYAEVARKRIAHWTAEREREQPSASRQLGLFGEAACSR